MVRNVNEVISRDYTINLHKRLHGISAKKRAPRAIKQIKKFAQLNMGTPDIRVDTGLNKALWANGICKVPLRMRLRLSRLRNEQEGQEGKFYTLVSHVEVPKSELRHLTTTTVEEQ